MAPKGPYKLCTVNTAPERAKRLVGRVVEDVKEDYTILHVENAERIEDVKSMCERNKPDVLVFCSSFFHKVSFKWVCNLDLSPNIWVPRQSGLSTKMDS